MLLCQNAQTFNLEGSLVSSTPATPAVNQPAQKLPCNLGYPTRYRSNMCSLLKKKGRR